MDNNKSSKKTAYLFENMWTIPNFMSFARILIVPFFAWAFLSKHYLVAIILLSVSGLSDLFDGKIARRFNQVSNLGKLLDPIADKITEMTIAVVLFITFLSSTVPSMKTFGWVFLLYIVKELFMLIVGAVMISKGIHPGAAEIYGKAATMTFYLVSIAVMCFGPEIGFFAPKGIIMPEWLMWTLVGISIVLAFVALASYFPSGLRQFKEYWASKKENDTEVNG